LCHRKGDDSSFTDRLLVPHHAPTALGTGCRSAVSVDSVVGVGCPALLVRLGCFLRLGCLASCRRWRFRLDRRANHEAGTSLLHFEEQCAMAILHSSPSLEWPLSVPQLSSSRNNCGSLAILRAVRRLGRSLGS